jgi:hypothetical protein
MAYAEETLNFTRLQFNPRSWELGALENLAFLSVQKGDFQRAKGYIDEGLKLAERLGCTTSKVIPSPRRHEPKAKAVASSH